MGTSYLDQKGSTLISTMVTVEVPTQDYPEIVTNWSVIDHHVYNKMFDRKAYTLYRPQWKLFARFSCQVYNELSDYDYASDVVLGDFKRSCLGTIQNISYRVCVVAYIYVGTIESIFCSCEKRF